MSYFIDSPDDMEVAFTTFPSNDPVRSSFGRASMFLSITTQADNLNGAAEFVSFWLNSVDAHRIMLGERGVIVNPVVAEAVTPYLSEIAQTITEFVSWTNAGNSSPFNPMRPEGAGEIVGVDVGELARLTDMVGFGQLSPEEAAQQFFDFGNATIR
jgi:multiple sugar transport system substrate-binding protein